MFPCGRDRLELKLFDFRGVLFANSPIMGKLGDIQAGILLGPVSPINQV
jgi:hypothetical protein